MTPQQFIEKAVEGGWGKESEPINKRGFAVFRDGDLAYGYAIAYDTFPAWPARKVDIRYMLLVPEAWQAVGKVERWIIAEIPEWKEYKGIWMSEYQYHMHRMIDALCEGKTIEEFLETL